MIRRLTPLWRLRATVAAVVLAPLVHLVKLDRLARWAAAGTAGRPSDGGVDDVALAEWVDRVLGWLPWPWRRTCLKRGIAIYALLARAGRPAELQVGVRRDETGELAAHAWLTRSDVPILEGNLEQLDRLRVIDTYAPGQAVS
ncbi:MAG: lasso peptide biosynthesis B2 protein [Gemmatimonadales bacterium]